LASGGPEEDNLSKRPSHVHGHWYETWIADRLNHRVGHVSPRRCIVRADLGRDSKRLRQFNPTRCAIKTQNLSSS
jgi:hypothetical protein